MIRATSAGPVRARRSGWLLSLCALLAALPAHASFLHGDTLAKVANGIALAVIVLVPIIGIVVFWMIHVLPEKIAHKRQHPQQEAIQVLCLLSLVFGGLLWPIAWLWAYSKPVLYKMAYGTDRHEEHAAGSAVNAVADVDSVRADLSAIRADLEKLAARDASAPELGEIRDRLAAIEPRLAARSEETR